jgi:pyruvate/2-oxoglutarate dehydrogenase complex dihydrolipoamide acyltransferase (E2) component
VRNIRLRPFTEASSFRRIAAAAWDDMYQATIYGQLKVRVEPVEAWLERAREKTGRKITLTHVVTKALAQILSKHPDMNAMIRFRSLYLREDVDVFLQVAIPSDDPQKVGKTDLSGVVVRKADTLSVGRIADYVTENARRIRTAGGDKEFERTKKQANTLPGWLLHIALSLVSWLQYTLNLDTTFLGAPRDPFGSAMVTSVGMFDAPVGFAPFFPLARCPIVVCIGTVLEEPVIDEAGNIVKGRVVNIQATMDHRVIDGFHAGILSKELKALMANPELLGDP